MAKAPMKQITMIGTRNYGGVTFKPGETPTLPTAFADHWIGLCVAVPYQTPEIAPPEAPEPVPAPKAAEKAKP